MPTRERRAKSLGVPVDELPDGRGKGLKASGPAHYRWNKSRILSEHGYVKVRVDKRDPLSDPNGYAYEHHVVWRSAGRQLPSTSEILHHKNEDKTDNRLSNLELLTRREHAAKHHMMVSDANVREIRVRYAAGEAATALAREFGIPPQRAYAFIPGKTRMGAGGPIQVGSLRNNANRSRVGKRAAGRLLDGRTHDGFPATQDAKEPSDG